MDGSSIIELIAGFFYLFLLIVVTPYCMCRGIFLIFSLKNIEKRALVKYKEIFGYSPNKHMTIVDVINRVDWYEKHNA